MFVNVYPFPYTWMTVISNLENVHFAFLPKLAEEITNNNIYVNFHPDVSFIGNMQPFIFFIPIFTFVFLLFWLLSNKNVNRWKTFRKKVSKVYKERVKYSLLFEMFYYT